MRRRRRTSIIEVEEELIEAGNRLLNFPSSIDELLNLLNRVEILLLQVDQSPLTSTQDALLPLFMAFIAPDLLNHSNIDVKLSLAFCINELMRITVPEPPYKDEIMKDIFRLTIAAFEMFKHHPAVFLDMETVMISAIEESDDITSDLLSPLLASVKKDQDISCTSFKLGMRVLTRSASKLKPYLCKALESMDIVLDNYAPTVVAAICSTGFDVPRLECEKAYDCNSDDRSNIQLENGLTERGRKPNSLINSAKGYDPWMHSGRKTPTPKKSHLGIPENQWSDYAVNGSTFSSKSKNRHMNEFPEFSPKVNENKLLNQDDNPLSMSVSKEVTLNVDVDKAPQSDTTLRKEQEGKRDSEIKKGKCSTKVNSDAAKIKKGIAEAPGDLILEEGAEILSYGEEKKTPGSANELGQKNGDDGSFVQMGSEKKAPHSANESGKKKGNDRSFGQTGSKKKSLIHEIANKKKTNHQGSEGKGTPKPKPKRKRSAEEDSGTPHLGEEMVGKRIKVWWPMDKKYYEGVVDSYDKIKRKHKVVYTDGDKEVLRLAKQRWKSIDDDGVSSNTWGEKEGETKSVTVEDKSNSEKRNHTKSAGGISLENQVLTSEYPSELECSKLDGEISVANLQSEMLKTNLDADRIEPTEKDEVPSKDEERVDNGNMAEGV
ncbi:hypothetical protein ACFE04_004617 [Oxalis oulophora]